MSEQNPETPSYDNVYRQAMETALEASGVPATTLKSLDPQALSNLFSQKKNQRIQTRAGFWETIEEVFEETVETVTKTIEETVETVKKTVEETVQKVKDTVESIKNTDWEDISDAIDDAGTFLEDLGAQAQDWTFSSGLDQAADLWNDTLGRLPGGEAINPFSAITAMDEMVSNVLGYSIFTNNPLGPMTPFGVITAIGTGLKEAKKAGTEAWKLIEATFDESALNDLEALLPKPGESPDQWISRAADSAQRLRERAVEAGSSAMGIVNNAWDDTLLSPFLKQYNRLGEGTSMLHDVIGDFMQTELARTILEIPLGGTIPSEKEILAKLAWWAAKQAKDRYEATQEVQKPIVVVPPGKRRTLDPTYEDPSRIRGPDFRWPRPGLPNEPPRPDEPFNPVPPDDRPLEPSSGLEQSTPFSTVSGTGHDAVSLLHGPLIGTIDTPENRMARMRQQMIRARREVYGENGYDQRIPSDLWSRARLGSALDYMDESIQSAKRSRYY